MNWATPRVLPRPVPVARDYFLVSHAPADRFGLYVIDRYGNRELLYLDPAIGSMCPTLLRPAPRPPVLGPARDGAADRDRTEPRASSPWPMSIGAWSRRCRAARSSTSASARKCAPTGAAAQRRVPQGPRAVPGLLRHADPQGQRPLRLAQLRGQGVAGPRARSKPTARPASTPRPARCSTSRLLDENFNELQRMRSVVQLQPGETAELHRLPRRPHAWPRRVRRPSPLAPRRRSRLEAAAVGRRAVRLREGRAAGVGRQVRPLPRRRGQAEASTSPARSTRPRARLLPHADRRAGSTTST